jgi:hypothetical protein
MISQTKGLPNPVSEWWSVWQVLGFWHCSQRSQFYYFRDYDILPCKTPKEVKRREQLERGRTGLASGLGLEWGAKGRQ